MKYQCTVGLLASMADYASASAACLVGSEATTQLPGTAKCSATVPHAPIREGPVAGSNLRVQVHGSKRRCHAVQKLFLSL